jgi:hypothetical protein
MTCDFADFGNLWTLPCCCPYVPVLLTSHNLLYQIYTIVYSLIMLPNQNLCVHNTFTLGSLPPTLTCPTVHNTFTAQVDALNIYEQSTRQMGHRLLTPIHLYHHCLCNPCRSCLLGLQVLFHLTSSLQRLLYMEDLIIPTVIPTGMLNNPTPTWDTFHLDLILMQ